MNKKQLFKIEYFVYFFVLLIPIFDFIFNQYLENSSYKEIINLNLIKLIIPTILYIFVLFKAKGKERIQLLLITFFFLIYSSITYTVYYNKFVKTEISEKEFLSIFNNIFNLTVFVFNFLIVYKIFFRKNTTRLRMSYNYVSAIYLIAILLLSLISNSEPIWQINISLIILMQLFIALVSLRYREDRTYSLILFVALAGYYITTIRNDAGYYAIFMTAIIYIVSLIIEKYVKNQLSFSDVNEILKKNINRFIKHLINLNKSRIRRLQSGDSRVFFKNINTYSSKRIYRYNDFNRRKIYTSKETIQKYKYALSLIREKTNKEGAGLKEVEERLKKKRREKRQEKIDIVLDSKPVKILFVLILILISVFILYIIFKFAKDNLVLEPNFSNKLIYFVYFIPLIYGILKTIYFIAFKFKNLDSEYIMLTLLIFYVFITTVVTKVIILDFSSAIILSTILVVLINKTHLGKTSRDIEILKEQVEYKKGLLSKKRVVFGISSLAIGGVSRILVDICNALNKKHSNLDVEIFTLFAGGEFEEGVNVKVVSLFKKPFNSYSPFKKFFISIYLKTFEPNIFNKHIRGNYDTIIAFDEGDITSLFSYDDQAKKIAWVHNKNYNLYSKDNKKHLKKTSHVYSRYNQIIFTREIGLRRFNKVFTNKKIKRIPKDVITNYVDPLRIFLLSEKEQVFEWTPKDRVLLSVVRLYKHKAVDRFIRVHKRVLNDGLFHKLYIIGDGPEMENLKKLIRKEKLQQSVFLLGTKVNPYPYIKNCNYFCLFSQKEEYSIVLNEAKILNKDILLTDTVTRDVVHDYPNVRIFDNSESGIYTGLRYVLARSLKDKTNFEYIYKNDDILKQIYYILN